MQLDEPNRGDWKRAARLARAAPPVIARPSKTEPGRQRDPGGDLQKLTRRSGPGPEGRR